MMATGQFGGHGGPNVGIPPPPMPHNDGPPTTRHFNNKPDFGGAGNQDLQQNAQSSNNGPSQGGNNSGGGPSRPIDLRVILTRDEVTFLFGFDDNLLNQLRQTTGAHIQLTDGDSFEYVLLVRGPIDIIFKAFSLVCRKLWELLTNMAGPGHNRPLKIRIAVPAVQCGSIIGKAGAKVKEIRDLTGAQIQVSHDTLPNSSERCVEISGAGDQCVQCAYHICCVMQDTPLRGEVIPYVPPVNNQQGQQQQAHQQPQQHPLPPAQDQWRPVFLCGDKAYVIDGPIARPAPSELLRNELAKTPLGGEVAKNVAHNLHTMNSVPDHMNPLALMSAIGKSQQAPQGATPQTSREMTVNSEMINMMLTQGQGQKLDEIRKLSGASVHISDKVQANGDCLITLSGLEASILLAQFLIQNNVEQLQKQHQHVNNVNNVEQNTNSHGLYPTNQFDPSIMQSNFNNENQPNSQQLQGGPQNNFVQHHQDQNLHQNNQQRGNYRNNFNENRFGHHRGRGRRSPPGDNNRRGRGRGMRR